VPRERGVRGAGRNPSVLERDGLVCRRPVTGAPERTVEYELSEPGLSLLPVIDHAPR